LLCPYPAVSLRATREKALASMPTLPKGHCR
jgi:hypothetical protein